jgi:hypothetical protein
MTKEELIERLESELCFMARTSTPDKAVAIIRNEIYSCNPPDERKIKKLGKAEAYSDILILLKSINQ